MNERDLARQPRDSFEVIDVSPDPAPGVPVVEGHSADETPVAVLAPEMVLPFGDGIEYVIDTLSSSPPLVNMTGVTANRLGDLVAELWRDLIRVQSRNEELANVTPRFGDYLIGEKLAPAEATPRKMSEVMAQAVARAAGENGEGRVMLALEVADQVAGLLAGAAQVLENQQIIVRQETDGRRTAEGRLEQALVVSDERLATEQEKVNELEVERDLLKGRLTAAENDATRLREERDRAIIIWREKVRVIRDRLNTHLEED